MTAVPIPLCPTPDAVRLHVEETIAALAADPRPEAWIHLRSPEALRAEAERVAGDLADGATLPLAGVTLAVKDNIDVAGLPTTCAAPWTSRIAGRNAPVVERLVAAGAIVLGKTNLDQFATGLVGTRSPYGAVRSALDETRISGGSSSGSAVQVAVGIADLALGTDTAGSGRVPAAFNGIVGIKPTLGLVPRTGIVPACPSYDTASFFARDLDLAALAYGIALGTDPDDASSRSWPAHRPLAAPSRPTVLVPRDEDLEPVDPAWREAFQQLCDRLVTDGWTIRTLDFSPLLSAAALLYNGALVAERFAAVGELLAEEHAGEDPTVAAIVRNAESVPAHRLVADQHRVLAARALLREALADADALLVPTTTNHPTFEEIAADPVGANARLGTYTNFVNPLDLCAVAVPVAAAPTGFGVTLICDTFADQVALDLAGRIVDSPTSSSAIASEEIELFVVGAHLRGLPLNHQLEEIGARFLCEATTAPAFRMLALPTTPPKPGVVAADTGGVSLPGEVWQVTAAGLGTLLSKLPEPMLLGAVRLSDGREVVGFRVDLAAVHGATDITEYGGWRAYLAQGVDRP